MRISAWLALGVFLAGAMMAPREAYSAELGSLKMGVAEIVEDLTRKCQFDLKTYCSMVTPGEGRLAFCLMANADKRSPQCEYALFDASRAADKLIETANPSIAACRSDIDTHCSGLEVGTGDIAKCLAGNKPALSNDCGEVIDVVGKVIFPAHNQSVADSSPVPSVTFDSVAEAQVVEPAEASSRMKVLTALDASVREIIEKGKQGCGADLEAFCSNVAPGEGRLAFCLIAHADKRSAACESALGEARGEAELLIEKVSQSIDACLPDIAALCTGTKPGEGRIVQCLTDQKAMLTEPCGEIIDKVGMVVFPARNQTFAESAAPASTAAGISTGTINVNPGPSAVVSAAPKCRTVGSSVTDWGQEATSRDARKLLDVRVKKFTAKEGIREYTAGRGSVTCTSNIDLIVAGNYTCRAQTKVCWPPVPAETGPAQGASSERAP